MAMSESRRSSSSNKKNKDSITSLFNRWSVQGLDREIERGHGYAVQEMLKELHISHEFDFLDVGCGNGWTVRYVSRNPFCRSAYGIDVSEGMIRLAKELKESTNQHFLNKDLLAWDTRRRFDVIFSMEALYYNVPIEPALKKIYELIREGGQFLCGVDYYRENRESHAWPEKCNIRMDLRSKKEWVLIFRNVGFINVKQRNILYPVSVTDEKWKRRFGTLFMKGRK
jgi:SAM-dependent methyltransferase